MATSHWIDISTRSRDSDSTAEPTALNQQVKGLRVVLHRHIHYPGDWLVSCVELNIFMRVLGNIPLNDAKKDAVDHVRDVACGLAIASEKLKDA